jgi:hypothetical protein
VVDLARSYAAAWRLGKSHFDYAGDPPAPRGLLIGEAPGPNTNPKLPLFPEPNSSAAGRLLRYADVEHADYMGKLVRMNLCDGEWSERRAVAGRVRAVSYLLDSANFYDGVPLRVLLLGKRVAAAWACHGPFGCVTQVYPGDVELRVAWIPHPSGRCHLYNDRKNQLRARRAVQWAVGERSRP